MNIQIRQAQTTDVDAIAAKMARLLDAPEEAAHLGSQGRQHVRTHFLLPELVRRYLILLQFHTGNNQELPEFRLNDLTYSETINVVKAKNMLNKTRASQEQCTEHVCCKKHSNVTP